MQKYNLFSYKQNFCSTFLVIKVINFSAAP
nr:MAG TPA: hypothetical protein [Caudoviricetes sp.]